MTDRRDFLKRLALGTAGMCLAGTGRSSSTLARPNIVLILVDDMGFSDLGCYGGEIETPNLDRLAEGGVRFSQFYNTAKCAPTRAALMTGLYHPEVRVKELKDCVTIAEVLRDAGYFTLMTGKWHLEGEPTDRGFERYFGHLSGACNFFRGDDTFRLNGKPFKVPEKGFYTTDANTDYALTFLDEAEGTDKPFFLYIAYNAPHYPLQAPKEEVMKYRGKYQCGWDELRKKRYAKQLEMGLFEKEWGLSPRPGDVPAWDSLSDEVKDKEDLRMATFSGMIDRVDQNVGRLVERLDKTGRLDNTLILFLSDNGACPFQRSRHTEFPPWDPRSYWTYDQKWAHACNTPFRWYKQNQHEGGVSTPLIAHWPKGLRLDPGSIRHEVGHLVDIMATCVDVAGAAYPERFGGHPVQALRGKSLLPVLQRETRQEHESLFFQFSNNRAVRKGRWKLVSARGGPWELYDMEVDRTELDDLSKKMPEKVKKMEALWLSWAEQFKLSPMRRKKRKQ